MLRFEGGRVAARVVRAPAACQLPLGFLVRPLPREAAGWQRDGGRMAAGWWRDGSGMAAGWQWDGGLAGRRAAARP